MSAGAQAPPVPDTPYPAARGPKGGAAPRRVKDIVTPEGVALRLTLAGIGDRIAAFLFDLLLIGLAAIGIFLAGLFSALALGSLDAAAFALALALFGWFLVRAFYFTFFEIRWNGATPGKRRVGIRVVDARGGMLSSDAVIVRNLLREVEFFLPILVFLAPEQVWPGAPGWLLAIASAWLLGFMLLPLLNRDRLRAGDLAAGTIVVAAPKPSLLEDLGDIAATAAGEGQFPGYTFTAEQLDVYGIYELQVLEDLLRQPNRDPRTVQLVCDKIKAKIGWPHERWDVYPLRFLRDFYAAQRAHLERRMLLGERKESKEAGKRARER